MAIANSEVRDEAHRFNGQQEEKGTEPRRTFSLESNRRAFIASRWFDVLTLAAFCGVLFFLGLNVGEIYRTESLRAIIAQEFLRTGNWLVPMLYGEPLLTKPPGMYAAIAAVSWPFGEVTEWSARLPSALAASGIVLLMYWYVGRQVGRLGGLIAAVITPCTYMWLDKATAAEIDMLQVFWVAAALLFFFRATEEQDTLKDDAGHPVTVSPCPPASFRWWLLALLCVAGGVLTKWTAGVFFYAAAVPFLIWRRQWRLLFSWQHLVSALVGGAVCFAWVGAVVYQVGWDNFAETLWQEAGPRINPSLHVGNHVPLQAHWLETVEHPFKLLLANLPWAVFLLPTLLPSCLRQLDDRSRRLVQAFHCWTWPNILVWTLLPDHATRHSFPLFPGITGLAAMAWITLLARQMPQRWERRQAALGAGWLTLFGATGAAMLIALACVMAGIPVVAGKMVVANLLPASVWWLVPVLAVGMLWSASAGWRAFRAQGWGQLLTCFIICWLLLKVAFVQIYVPDRNDSRHPRAKAEALAELVPQGKALYLIQLKDEGIMFYYRRPVLRLKKWDDLPLANEPVYCIMTPLEREQSGRRDQWTVVAEKQLHDAQGLPMFFLAICRGESPIRQANSRGTGHDAVCRCACGGESPLGQ